LAVGLFRMTVRICN